MIAIIMRQEDKQPETLDSNTVSIFEVILVDFD